MTRVSERFIRVLVSWAVVLGCAGCDKKNAESEGDSGTTSIDGTSTGEGTSTTTATTESSSSGDGDDCQPGLTSCGDACVDLQVDDANCGECGTACTIVDNLKNGGCEAGSCEPSFGVCFAEGEFLNCNEACAAEGRGCVAQGCWPGSSTLYVARVADWCEGFSDGFEYPGPCSLSLADFGVDGGGFDLTHGRCCCADPTAG